jgi:multidrug resistance efflux pump
LLQDRFFEHMRDAGYEGFERGVRGSTDKHLSTLDYKVKQDTERLASINRTIEKQQTELSNLDEKVKNASAVKSELNVVSHFGKKKMFGKIELTESEYADLTTLAKEGITSRRDIEDLRQRLRESQSKFLGITSRFNELIDETRDIREAARFAPQKIKALCAEILRTAKEGRENTKSDMRYSGR